MKNTPKPSYKELQLENKKLVKEISQIAIKNVELEKEVTRLKIGLGEEMAINLTLSKSNKNLRELNSTLSDNAVHFQSERAELALALVEISNCKDLELVKEIARIALNGVYSVVKLKDTVPF